MEAEERADKKRKKWMKTAFQMFNNKKLWIECLFYQVKWPWTSFPVGPRETEDVFILMSMVQRSPTYDEENGEANDEKGRATDNHSTSKVDEGWKQQGGPKQEV